MVRERSVGYPTFCLIGCRLLFFTEIRSRAAECSNCWHVDGRVGNTPLDTKNSTNVLVFLAFYLPSSDSCERKEKGENRLSIENDFSFSYPERGRLIRHWCVRRGTLRWSLKNKQTREWLLVWHCTSSTYIRTGRFSWNDDRRGGGQWSTSECDDARCSGELFHLENQSRIRRKLSRLSPALWSTDLY